MRRLLRANIGPTRRPDETTATFLKRLSIYSAGTSAVLMIVIGVYAAIWTEAISEPELNPILNFVYMLLLMIFSLLFMGAILCFIGAMLL